MKKNWLCSFVVDVRKQNIGCSFSGYCGFLKTAITADRNGRIGDSGSGRTSDLGALVEDSQKLSSHQS